MNLAHVLAAPMAFVVLSQVTAPPACENAYPTSDPVKVSILRVAGTAYLADDGRGEYKDDRSSCVRLEDDARGFLNFAVPAENIWPECQATSETRKWRIDLSHPVVGQGGVDFGVRVTERPNLRVVTRKDASGRLVGLRGMQIGEKVSALFVQIVHHDNSSSPRILRLVFNPTTAGCEPWIMTGPGSTRATVVRTTATHWEVDLPEGTIARLYRGPLDPAAARDSGLYHFAARLTVDSLPKR